MNARTDYLDALARAAANRRVQRILAGELEQALAAEAVSGNMDPFVDVLERQIHALADAARDADIEAGQIAARHPEVVSPSRSAR